MTMRRSSYIFSGILHSTIALVTIFGLPVFFKDKQEVTETAMMVDVIAMSDVSSPPPPGVEKPPEPKPVPPKTEPQKVEPPTDAQRVVDDQQKIVEDQKKIEEQKKVEAEQRKIEDERKKVVAEQKRIEDEQKKAAAEQRAEQKRVEDEQKRASAEQQRIADEKAEQLRIAEEKAAEQKKIEEQKKIAAEQKRIEDERKKIEEQKRIAAEQKKVEDERKKAAEEKKKRDALFASLNTPKVDTARALASLGDPQPTPPAQPAGSPTGRPTDRPASATDLDRIRTHVIPYWQIPAGAQDADKMVVKLRISLQEDGSVTGVQIEGKPSDANVAWTAMADSAMRAVRLASPLPIPRDKADQFRSFTITFSPKNAH